MGWMEFMESGSCSIKEWELACVMIVYGPRFFWRASLRVMLSRST